VKEVEHDGEQPSFLLESWAYATDGVDGFFGSSGCLPLPRYLVEAVVEKGEDLGPAANRIFEQEDVAGRQGTFGILTADVITREEAFVRAVLHALAPFYNRATYGAPLLEPAVAKHSAGTSPKTAGRRRKEAIDHPE
jgi:non-canonical (house-cleaning) NTP pyrophosphatase